MLFLIAILVFIINIPFGFWRGMLKKLSFKWFVAIHAPVIISIGLRYLCNIDLNLNNIVIFVGVFFLGQFFGKNLYKWYNKNKMKIAI